MNHFIKTMILKRLNYNSQIKTISLNIIHFILKQMIFQKKWYKVLVLKKDKLNIDIILKNETKVLMKVNSLNLKQVDLLKVDPKIYLKVFMIKHLFGLKIKFINNLKVKKK